MEYFIPKTGKVTIPSPVALAEGSLDRTFSLICGIHEIPDELADNAAAIAYGIKPVEEMTDAEWVSIGRQKPKAEADAPADEPAPRLTDVHGINNAPPGFAPAKEDTEV